jgi:hypothetical protein
MNLTAFAGLGGLILMLASSPGMTIEPQASTYLLEMKIHDGDRLVASPQLTVVSGESATIEIAEKDGNRYRVEMTAAEQAGETVFIKSMINVVSRGVHQSFAPNILVTLKKSSGFVIGTDSATSKPIRVDLTVNQIG